MKTLKIDKVWDNDHCESSKNNVVIRLLTAVNHFIDGEARTRRRRSQDVIGPKIVELMITIDKPTYDFYGNDTMEYVLNVANMVNASL